MDAPIRPVDDSPVTGPAPVRRRRENRDQPFELERELAGEPRQRPREDADERANDHPNTHEDVPVAPPEEGEAGGRLDVTA